MPKIEYPAYFDNGLVGARCEEEIEHREAFLFVPYKMLLSVSKIKDHEVLGPVILDHPELTQEEGREYADNIILTLALIYEVTLGKESYWYPYLRQMPDVVVTSLWDTEDIEMT